MRQTDKVTAILGKKLIANEIEGSGHVTAAIHICVKCPLIIDEESIDPIPLADQPKFLDRSWPHILDPGDHPPTPPALLLHPGLIAEEQNPAD